MTTIIFDTHAFIKKLKATGFTEDQAEILAESQSEIIENNLITRQDLKNTEITILAKMEKGFAGTKVEIIKWVAGMLVAQAAVVASIIKLL